MDIRVVLSGTDHKTLVEEREVRAEIENFINNDKAPFTFRANNIMFYSVCGITLTKPQPGYDRAVAVFSPERTLPW